MKHPLKSKLFFAAKSVVTLSDFRQFPIHDSRVNCSQVPNTITTKLANKLLTADDSLYNQSEIAERAVSYTVCSETKLWRS